jgi:hypothetical protein
MRLPRPSTHRLSAALALLGVLAGVAFLVVPVEAAFAGDPLLRLPQAFGSAPSQATSGVDCGSPLTNLGHRGDGLSLYSVARDHACRDASSRRVATAVAVAGVVGLLGALGLTRAPDRRVTV